VTDAVMPNPRVCVTAAIAGTATSGSSSGTWTPPLFAAAPDPPYTS
jgi:hypothetical protein